MRVKIKNETQRAMAHRVQRWLVAGSIFWMLAGASTGWANVWTGESSPDCIPAPADYDGDGAVDLSLKCGGAWHFFNENGSYLKGIWTGGVPGDLPVPADYDGDGDADVVVFRSGAWLFFSYATGTSTGGVWTGSPGTPVPLDRNGDGRAEFSVYQNGAWHFYNDDGTYLRGIWTGGLPQDIPVPGDYDGNAQDEIVIFRGGAWLFYDFTSGANIRGVWTGASPYGGVPLQPAPLDHDGDGTVDFSIYAGGPWHFYSDNGSYLRGIWTGGVPDDRAVSRRLLTR